MSSEEDEQYNHHSSIIKNKYKLWKNDLNVPVSKFYSYKF